MPLDTNSPPPHLRGMLCTCWLLTPPQTQPHHKAPDWAHYGGKQLVTSQERQQNQQLNTATAHKTVRVCIFNTFLSKLMKKIAHCARKMLQTVPTPICSHLQLPLINCKKLVIYSYIWYCLHLVAILIVIAHDYGFLCKIWCTDMPAQTSAGHPLTRFNFLPKQYHLC